MHYYPSATDDKCYVIYLQYSTYILPSQWRMSETWHDDEFITFIKKNLTNTIKGLDWLFALFWACKYKYNLKKQQKSIEHR